MFGRNIYYTLKPILPLNLRRVVRNYFARRKLDQVGDIWPIWEPAGKKPKNWLGWPDEKQFAFVLTHDVEGRRGLENVRRLAELEMKLGFRSSFNFVPEGSYSVPLPLITWLKDNRFEVGVHDLHHNGKLYRSRDDFARKAQRINGYLKKWGAVGFRSGFMHHNLDWAHELDVLYDASTFDTDPFEPQPDGVGTIFPFWVPRPQSGQSKVQSHESKENSPSSGDLHPSDLRPSTTNSFDLRHSTSDQSSDLSPSTSDVRQPSLPSDLRLSTNDASRRSGYVELPYTLPQDSTLFSVFRETSPDIWLRKLNWIAQQEGMALLNTHPDYMDFDGENKSGRYPASHYAKFLDHVSTQLKGRYWHPLPVQVARVFRASYTEDCRPLKPRRICMISYSHYESDNRVLRYAHALHERGDIVDAIAVNSSDDYAEKEEHFGVNVHRLQRRERNEKRKMDYLRRTLRFYRSVSRELRHRHHYNPYDLVHVHNVPDFLVFAARYPKRNGARVILDLHDILPEFFASKFSSGSDSLAVRILKVIERWSCRFADHVIISNHLWFETVVARSVSRDRCSAFINYVDLDVFAPRARRESNGRRIILYPGGLQWHQGLDIAIEAFAKVRDSIPKVEFHIHGGGPEQKKLEQMTSDLGLGGSVRFFPSVPHHEVPDLMAAADLGVVPKRANSFGNEAYSTKIMEFMSQQVPVVVSNTKIDQFYFDDSVVRFFESGDAEALADAMLDVLTDREVRDNLVANANEYSRTNSWATRRNDYLRLVDQLVGNRHVTSNHSQQPEGAPATTV